MDSAGCQIALRRDLKEDVPPSQHPPHLLGPGRPEVNVFMLNYPMQLRPRPPLFPSPGQPGRCKWPRMTFRTTPDPEWEERLDLQTSERELLNFPTIILQSGFFISPQQVKRLRFCVTCCCHVVEQGLEPTFLTQRLCVFFSLPNCLRTLSLPFRNCYPTLTLLSVSPVA